MKAVVPILLLASFALGFFLRGLAEKGVSVPIQGTEKLVSGAPMKHTAMSTGDSVVVDTKASGVGESTYTIPYQQIPPARDWIEKVWGVQALVGPVDKSVEITGWRRFGSFAIGAGVGVGLAPIRLSPVVGAQYWFNL